MNSYYPASFFAQYSSDNPHMSHNVGYNSNNFGFLASRFADQLSAYHNNNFNSEHHRLANGYSAYHQSHDSHSRQNSSGNSSEHGGRQNFQPPPAHQSEDNLVSRSFSNCSTENWSPPPHGAQSGSPDSLHNSTSPYSNNADSNCPLMLQKNLKSDQSSGSEPATPFYPWMGIVGKSSALNLIYEFSPIFSVFFCLNCTKKIN